VTKRIILVLYNMKDKLKEILFSIAIGLAIVFLAMLVLLGFLILSFWTDHLLFPITFGVIVFLLGLNLGRQIWRQKL
jgi:xanthine/uracil permease